MRHATAASRGIRWGATPPEGGGKGTAGLADRRAARVVSSAGRATFLILAMRRPGTARCAVSSTA